MVAAAMAVEPGSLTAAKPSSHCRVQPQRQHTLGAAADLAVAVADTSSHFGSSCNCGGAPAAAAELQGESHHTVIWGVGISPMSFTALPCI